MVNTPAVLPSDVTEHVGRFDRFAGWSSTVASRAGFFTACLLLILIWAPTVTFLNFDTWQLLINTATTIVTFLLVALLQNSQSRNDQATQHKLNAIADGLGDLMLFVSAGGKGKHPGPDLTEDVKELNKAVGLETKESTT